MHALAGCVRGLAACWRFGPAPGHACASGACHPDANHPLRRRPRGDARRRLQPGARVRIVGAAGLVRYRAKIADPKDAGVMLSTLASGSRQRRTVLLATFSTVFISPCCGSWSHSSRRRTSLFLLKSKPRIRRRSSRASNSCCWSHIEFELRSASKEESGTKVAMPLERKTDRVSTALLALDPQNATAVEWKRRRPKPEADRYDNCRTAATPKSCSRSSLMPSAARLSTAS